MWAKPGTCQPGSSAAPEGGNPLQIGIDPLHSDCVFKTKSGSSYHTSKAVLATASPFFKDLVESCEQTASLDAVGQDHVSDPCSQTLNKGKIFEIPLEDDAEEEIIALVEHLHQPDRFWGSLVPVVTKEGATKLLKLAPIAFKYDIQGNSKFRSLSL